MNLDAVVIGAIVCVVGAVVVLGVLAVRIGRQIKADAGRPGSEVRQ